MFHPEDCRAVPVPAAAQASDARGFLMINAGTQTASAEFSGVVVRGNKCSSRPWPS